MGTLLAATMASVVLAGAGVDPALKTLLRTTAVSDSRHESEFFRALVKLGTRHGVSAADLTSYDSGESETGGRSRCGLTSGRAVIVRGQDGPRVIAVLKPGGLSSVPGIAAEQLVALDPSGRVTDRLACGINSRYGDLTTEFPAKPEVDGAELVVRFVPNRLNGGGWHNWHTITRDGKGYTIWAKDEGNTGGWAKQGLLRAVIRGGKFRVLFPALPEPAVKTP